jgi:uncharacterized membrane protein YcgQ (UPF0703/DUF1980 family)
MAERKKYPYDEKAKNRITRCLKSKYEQLGLTLPKGSKAKYKAFAASRGMSITEMITRYLDSEIERTGFVYEPEEQDGE